MQQPATNGRRNVSWPVIATVGIAVFGWSAVIINWAYRVDARIERMSLTITERVEAGLQNIKRLEQHDAALLERIKAIDETGSRRLPIIEERQQHLSRQVDGNRVTIDVISKKLDHIDAVLTQMRNELQARPERR